MNLSCKGFNFDKTNLQCFLIDSMGPSQVNPQFMSGAKVCDNNKGQYKRSLSERGLPVGFKDLKVTKMWKRTKKGSFH